MEKVKVIEVERYRDGGTVIYEDALNRRYYQWWPTKKIYNQPPFSRGSVGRNNVPDQWVNEIPVELEILKSFTGSKTLPK
jgi:hypothetical protein